eukprot:gene2386-biopygen5828
MAVFLHQERRLGMSQLRPSYPATQVVISEGPHPPAAAAPPKDGEQLTVAVRRRSSERSSLNSDSAAVSAPVSLERGDETPHRDASQPRGAGRAGPACPLSVRDRA